MKFVSRMGLDRTKIQIFVGSMAVMIIALLVTITFIYVSMYNLQKKNAFRYIGEIAAQMSGHLESLLGEIDILSLQVAMDERIQEILEREQESQTVTFEDKMRMRNVMMSRSIYSEMIEEFELYALENSIYPVVDKTIEERVGVRFVEEAGQPHKAGKLIWMGWDPEHPASLLAIRQVKLENKGYQPGGYVLVRVSASLLESIKNDLVYPQGFAMTLMDADRKHLLAAAPAEAAFAELENSKDQYIHVAKTIPSTQWMLEIWVPEKAVMEELSFLRDVLLWGSVISVILSALLSYFGSLLITSPLKRLTGAMVRGHHGVLKENPEVYFNRDVNRLNMKYNRMVREINHLFKSVYEKEMLKIKSEIKALHSQINPHFLFNTLDALYWMHVRKGEKELSFFIAQLADLLRYTIQNDGNDGFVTVREELNHVQRYVDIMKIRWRDRLRFSIERDPGAEKYRIPKLTIQPLVENAIIHGIEPMEHGGTVRVTVRVREECLFISVRDDGAGIRPERMADIQQRMKEGLNKGSLMEGRGVGLFNVHQLLRLHYGEPYGLEISSEEDRGTTVVITLPTVQKGADQLASIHSGRRR